MGGRAGCADSKGGVEKDKGGITANKIIKVSVSISPPHTTMGVAPSEFLIGRRLRSQLDLVLPSAKSHVRRQQFQQKQQHDMHACERTFTLNDDVFVKNFASASPNWLPGKIVTVRGPVSYDIQLKNGKMLHRHIDHVRTGIPMQTEEPENEEQSGNITDNAGMDNSPQLRRSQRTIRPPQRYGDPAT